MQRNVGQSGSNEYLLKSRLTFWPDIPVTSNWLWVEYCQVWIWRNGPKLWMLNFGLVLASELGDSKTKTIELCDFETDDLGRLTIIWSKTVFCASQATHAGTMVCPGEMFDKISENQLIAIVTNSATILLWTLLSIKMMMHAAREIWWRWKYGSIMCIEFLHTPSSPPSGCFSEEGLTQLRGVPGT